MIRSLIEYFGRRKNPAFALDPSISSSSLLAFAWEQGWSFLRGWKLLLRGRVPRMLFLGKNVRLHNLHNIEMGRMIRIKEQVMIEGMGKSPMVIGDQVSIGAYSRIFTTFSLNDPGAFIRIGNNVGIGDFAHLGGAGGLSIGDDCIIGPFLSCHPENHVYDNPTIPIRLQGVTRKGIEVGKNCWIGAKVTILDGVTIGDNCIIAAGAVVTRPMPANSIIGGVPAKVLKPVNPVSTPATNLIHQNA